MEERMSFKLSCSVGLVIAALAVGIGCGGGDGGSKGTGGATGTGGSGSGSGGAGGSGPDFTKAPCYAYCVARDEKKDCDPSMSVGDCTGYTSGCGNEFATKTTACQNAYKAYWTCIAAQADPCDLPGTCGAQGEAVGPACN
jgi:hypothetical protein